ncbi:MAG: hypothetical protein Ct9H90mP9_4680 [Pseudomonadota bacterium]|nr:MAG: hypothetical protein Ct9H90mP9_4680 [Pseudomonadota bacterium]
MRNSFAPPSSAPRLQLDLLRTTVLKHFQSPMSESHVDSTGLLGSFRHFKNVSSESYGLCFFLLQTSPGKKIMKAKEKHVYLFSELDQAEAYAKDGWDSVRGLLGGKGANLADMTRLGVPVPPGLPSPPNFPQRFLEARGRVPGRNLGPGFGRTESGGKPDGKEVRRPSRTLSWGPVVRGQKFSMPGMMGTGLKSDSTSSGRADDTPDQERFVFDLYRRLIQMFGSVVMDVPDEVFLSGHRSPTQSRRGQDRCGNECRGLEGGHQAIQTDLQNLHP